MHYFCRIGASQSQMSVKTRGKQINFTSLAEGDLMSDEDVSGVASPSPRRQSNVIRCPVCDRTEDQTTAEEIWYGCDFCIRWYHRGCLPLDYQTEADLTVLESTNFKCPMCADPPSVVDPICALCGRLESTSSSVWMTCSKCKLVFHSTCVPVEALPDQMSTTLSSIHMFPQEWLCISCDPEN